MIRDMPRRLEMKYLSQDGKRGFVDMYIPMNERLYNYEINKRSKLDIFDYLALSQPMRRFSKEYAYNDYYGNDRAVKNYLNMPYSQRLEAIIEHGGGMSMGFFEDEEHPRWDNTIIYTYGVKRKKFLKETFPWEIVHNIGPFIKYAQGIYLPEEWNRIKQRYGKILLVFPCHSTPDTYSHNNVNEIITEIERIKNSFQFDSVFMCLYWKDILLEKFHLYEKMKYNIVTAGHMYDCLFLNRLRSIISLADVVMTDQIGTHVIYSTALHKPLYLFRESFVETLIKHKYDDATEEIYYQNGLKEQIEWYKYFGQYSEKLTDEQRYFISQFEAE